MAQTEVWLSKHLTEILPGISGPDELRKLNQVFPDRYPFLLQSTARGGDLGRFDILFALPGEHLALNRNSELSGRFGQQSLFLDALDNWWAEERVATQESELPYLGGWFLYLGYELAAEVEPSLQLHDDPLLPAAFAVRCPAAIIYDHLTHACTLAFEEGSASDVAQIHTDIAELGNAKTATESLSITV